MAADMTGDRAAISEREMISEKVAPTLVTRVLNSFDLVVIFVALVLFIPNASTVQFAGSAAFVFWGLGFLTFLIPGAFVTAQLARMFPEEGSLYLSCRSRSRLIPACSPGHGSRGSSCWPCCGSRVFSARCASA